MKIPVYPAQPGGFLVYFNRRSDTTIRATEGMPNICSSIIFKISIKNPWKNHWFFSRTKRAKPAIFTTTALIQIILTGLTMLHPLCYPITR